MPGPSFEVLVAWTRTGEVIDQLEEADWSYQESISWADLGSAKLAVPLKDKHGRSINKPLLKAIDKSKAAMSVCIAREGRALWAGPVWTFGWSSRAATVGCASIPKLLDSRVVLKNPFWGGPLLEGANLRFDLGTRDLVLELLAQAITGHRRDLPIIVPPQSGNTGSAIDYIGADLHTAYDAIKDVVDRDDGPDVLLQPELYADGDRLRWNALVGDPDLGTAGRYQPGDSVPTWDWPVSIIDLSGDSDGGEMVSTGYVVGDTPSGSQSRRIGVAVRDRGDPLPALERADRTTVAETRQEQLDALAASYIDVHAYSTEDWKIDVHPQHTPLFGDEASYGDAVRITVDASHGYVDEGDYLRRLVAVSGSRTKLTLITTDGAEVGWPRMAA